MTEAAVFVSLAVCGIIAIASVVVSFLAVRVHAARSERHDALMADVVKHLSNCVVMPEGDQLWRIRAEHKVEPPIQNPSVPIGSPLSPGRLPDEQWVTEGPERDNELD